MKTLITAIAFMAGTLLCVGSCVAGVLLGCAMCKLDEEHENK